MANFAGGATSLFELGQSDYRGLLINLVASLIWAAVGAAAYRYAFIPARRNRTLLSRTLPFNRRRPISICYGLMPPSPASVYYSVAEGDLSAINFADSTLTSVYGINGIRTYSFYIAEMRLGELVNILTISGPKWNRVTELMMGRLGVPFSFDKTDGLVVTRTGGASTVHHAERSVSGDEKVCYGFVCGGDVHSPTGKRQHVVICAGLNTLSTYGAVVFLMSLRELFSFRKYPDLAPRKRGARWGVVLRVENTSVRDSSGPVRNPVDSDHMDIKVISVLSENDFRDPFVYRF